MILRHFLLILSCVSIVLQKTYGSNIPGIPGVDYPNFNEIPPTSFRCPESDLRGFYPDFETRCQVFHYCEDGNRETFICPIGYVFNPLIKSCDRWFNYECNAPQQYNEERGYGSQTNYEVASDGGVASLFQPSNRLYDKMASLFEDRPGEANGQYEIENGPRVNPNVDQYSEYESSGGNAQHQVDTMGENEESRRDVSEISRGDIRLDLKRNEGFENGGSFHYELNDRNEESWDTDVSEDGANMKSSFQDGANRKNRGIVHSEREINMEKKNEGIVRGHTSASASADGYKGVGSYSDQSEQSSKGLGVLYYRNPTIYNYHTRPNERNGNREGDSISYEEEVTNAEGDSYASMYDRDMDFDDFVESNVESDQSMDLQKRISEYRRRPRPKPVVSLVESDLEIVTLPPLRQKRPRIPLVQKSAEPSVTEPMTMTTELSTDPQLKSETTEPSSAGAETKKSTSDDVTGDDDESRMSSDFQQERRGKELDIDWFTEESSGDAEDFLQTEDLDESVDLNQNEMELEETDTNMEQLHNMMRPNLFYLDSNSDHSEKEKVPPLDLSTDKSSDKQYEESYGTTFYDYKNEEFGKDHRVHTEEYNHDNFDGEIEDSSEIVKSNQYGDDFDTEKYQYENNNEDTEGFGEMFQTVFDGEIKSVIRFGEEIIDPTEYYPDWEDESSAEKEKERLYDAVGEASEKYEVENSNGNIFQSEESQDLNSFHQNMKTSSEVSEGYFTDNESSYQDGNSSPDFAAYLDRTDSEDVTFIPSSEYEFPTTEANDMMNANGIFTYDGSSDSDTLDSFYTGDDDVGFNDDPSFIPPVYTGEQANLKEEGATNENIVMSPDDDATSSDVIYYYTTDMGSQFVTDQPDMDVDTITVTDDKEYVSNIDYQGDSEYVYEVSQSDDSDSDEEFKEEYLTTHSAVSDVDVQFVTDQPDFGISSTFMPDKEEYTRDASIQGESDVEFQEQYFQTDSYDSDLGSQFVTDQPDIEMPTTALFDGEEYSKDTADTQGESRIALDMSNSSDSDSDVEFKEYIQADSDFSELKGDSANEKESKTDVDEVEQDSELKSHQDDTKPESDASFETFPSGFDNTGTSDISKTMDSNFDKSFSSNTHLKMSETAQKSHSKETSLDSLSVPNFDFDSVEDTRLEMENESSEEDLESLADESSTGEDSKFKSQSACSTCQLSFSSGKRPRTFSSSRHEMMDSSRHPGRTGKLLEGSKLAKLASFVKKMVAAKKKAKINIVKKILPSSEWNAEA